MYPCQPYSTFLDLLIANKSDSNPGFFTVPFWDDSFERQYLLTVDTGQLMMDGVSFQDRFNTNTTGGLQRFEGLKDQGTNQSSILAFRSSNVNTRTRIDGVASGITIEASSDGFVTVGGGIGVASSGVSITGLQSFSGTDTPGLQLKSLTTAQITALGAIGNGSILIDSTTNRVDVRLNGVTEELIDTAGGQAIGGNINVGGLLTAASSSNGTTILQVMFENTNAANNAGFMVKAGSWQIGFRTSPSKGWFEITDSGGSIHHRWMAKDYQLASDGVLGWSSENNYATGGTGARQLSLSYASAGVLRIGTTTNNALGSLLLTNLTASGTVTASGTGTHTFGTTSTITISSGLLAANGPNGGFVVNDRTTSAQWYLYSSANRLRILGTVAANADFVTITSTGVGIGNSVNPAAKLHIADAIQANLDLQRTTTGGTPTTGAYWRLFVDNVGGGGGNCTFGFYDVANAALRFGVENDGRFRVFSNLTVDQTIRLGSFTVGTLPSASANTRARAFVTDTNLAFNSTNLGATVTAGGSTLVPVFSNGTNWVIG